MTRGSFSSAELIRRCGYWLTEGAVWTSDEEGDFAAGGTIVHALLAALVHGGTIALPEDPALRAMYAGGREWLLARKTLEMRAEVAFAFDVDTGAARELVDPPGAEPRWYVDPIERAAYRGPGGPIRDSEICGRLDLHCMGLDADGAFACVWDYACQFGFERADKRAQLELQSLALARTFGVERVRAVAVHLDAEGNAHEDGFDLFAEDLNAIAADLARDLNVDEETPPTLGPHCEERYCPAQATCPLTRAAVDEAVQIIPLERLPRGPAPGLRYSLTEPAETAPHFAFKLAMIPLLEAFVAVLKDETKAGADALDGFAVEGGGFYSAKTHIEENADLSAPGAVEALEALGLDLAIDSRPRVTWAAIALAAGKDKAIQEEAREALRAIPGAIRATPVTVYRVRGPVKAGAKGTAKKRAKASAS